MLLQTYCMIGMLFFGKRGSTGHIQRGYVYEASGAFFVRYNVTEIVDGKAKRVQRSHRLCAKGGKYYARDCKAAKLLRDEFMVTINRGQSSSHHLQQDMPVTEFWESCYLPYCTEILALTGKSRKKPSTIRGYKQIWLQHLKAHFGNPTLQEYEPHMGTQLLLSLTGTLQQLLSSPRMASSPRAA
jgi:hypothetical protein